MPPHVVMVGFYPPPHGGESIHVRQLTQLLRERGLTVEAVNLNRHAHPSAEYRSARNRWARLRLVLTLPKRSSILHLHVVAHNWQSWVVVLTAAVAARLKGTASVLTLHSGLFPNYTATFGRLTRWAARWTLRSFTRIIAVNRDIGQAVCDLGIGECKVLVIPAFLGIRHPITITRDDEALVNRFHPLLIAVGGGDRDPDLGLPVILEALPALLRNYPRLGAVFVGSRVGPKTQASIEAGGLDAHAVCLGEIVHARCLSLIREASVLIRSTYADGDAISVREALALGVPVVASEPPWRPDGVTVFRRGDAVDLTRQLDSLLKSTEPALVSTQTSSASGESLWKLYRDLASSVASSASRVPPGPEDARDRA